MSEHSVRPLYPNPVFMAVLEAFFSEQAFICMDDSIAGKENTLLFWTSNSGNEIIVGLFDHIRQRQRYDHCVSYAKEHYGQGSNPYFVNVLKADKAYYLLMLSNHTDFGNMLLSGRSHSEDQDKISAVMQYISTMIVR
jgi:hypothetical protein